MGSKNDNARKARDSRAMLDAATAIGKLPAKAPCAFKPGDTVAFHAAVSEAFRLFLPVGEDTPVGLTWTVTRLSGDDVKGGAVHVRIDPVKGASGSIIDPRPFGRTIHFAARAQSLTLVKSAAASRQPGATETA